MAFMKEFLGILLKRSYSSLDLIGLCESGSFVVEFSFFSDLFKS